MLDRLMNAAEVARTLGLTVSGFHTMRHRDRSFPLPVATQFRGMRWRCSEVMSWIENLPHQGDRMERRALMSCMDVVSHPVRRS